MKIDFKLKTEMFPCHEWSHVNYSLKVNNMLSENATEILEIRHFGFILQQYSTEGIIEETRFCTVIKHYGCRKVRV